MSKITVQHIKLVEEQGFCLIEHFFSDLEMEPLKSLDTEHNTRFCLDKIPQLKPFAEAIVKELQHHFKKLYFNRSILFNKTAGKNWSVLWHQDLSLCLKKKIPVDGYGPWSVKENIPHVQPPGEILKGMITARLHIDANNENNGALKVIPQSHKNGILNRDTVQKLSKNEKIHTCCGQSGSLLLMKPLILHSSSSSSGTSDRRVLHLEFLNQQPQSPLKLYHS